MKINQVEYDRLSQIVEDKKPKGLFYSYDSDSYSYIAVDNESGDCWVEEFQTVEDVRLYFSGLTKQEIHQRRIAEKAEDISNKLQNLNYHIEQLTPMKQDRILNIINEFCPYDMEELQSQFDNLHYILMKTKLIAGVQVWIDDYENMKIKTKNVDYTIHGFGDFRYAVKDGVITSKQAGKLLEWWINYLEI